MVSVVIPTFNEELNLPVCLDSLLGLDAQIVVVDSGSADRTREIAGRFGAEVIQHPFETQARQINWVLDNVPLSAPWIMRLDADERLTPELRDELKSVLPAASDKVVGFLVKRRVYFWGRWIRHGGYYPTWLLRIWRAGKGRVEDVWMDEHVEVTGGESRQLVGDIIDENRKGLAFWIEKHNGFSDREVKNIVAGGAATSARLTGGQAARRRFLKQNLYGRTPRILRAFLYWILRYFILLGFLDGKAGFVFHFMQGLWYRVVVDAKLHELERASMHATAAQIANQESRVRS
ncbi:MAG TPA: glycosyltransferase family 2 protein [Gemmataceae bacterium]|nr:glycosyltransferase family 2 protein [Gemmataceae bacterium]